jgi:hypothetical protein
MRLATPGRTVRLAALMRYDWRSVMATHQPVIWAAAEACRGPIAEFGCGHASTPSLHKISERRNIPLLSLETDDAWLARFRQFETRLHTFRLVADWDSELARGEWSERWGLIFVDQLPWEARPKTILRVAPFAEFVVLHDCDAAPDHGIGRRIRPVLGPRDKGERDFGDVFSSWREFFPPEPWPHKSAGPPTLIGSNLRDTNDLDINFLSQLPLWWRGARHVRRYVPQSLRMRVGNRIGWRVRRGIE